MLLLMLLLLVMVVVMVPTMPVNKNTIKVTRHDFTLFIALGSSRHRAQAIHSRCGVHMKLKLCFMQIWTSHSWVYCVVVGTEAGLQAATRGASMISFILRLSLFTHVSSESSLQDTWEEEDLETFQM